MKKHFLTGLVILLPIAITFILVNFVINIFTKPFLGVLESIFNYYGRLPHSSGIFSGDQLALILSKILIILFLVALTFFIGIIGRNFLLKHLFHATDFIFHRIPVVNRIYKGAQDTVQTIFKSDSRTFSQVVLVPFPHSRAHCIGLITNEHLPQESDDEHKDLISIFVPGTPNPTMGFMLLYKRNQVKFVDMSTEDAFKFIMSCGVMFSGFEKKSCQP